jgi:hypothetical protein
MAINLDQAIRTFDLSSNHRTIYDPNDLIAEGFPATFLLPLIGVFESDNSYIYYLRGKIVEQMIGVSHVALVSAIAKHLGLPDDIGSGFTGGGFRLDAIVSAIRKVLSNDDGPGRI